MQGAKEFGADLSSKKNNVILLRWLLVISTSCLILFDQHNSLNSIIRYLFILGLIASNLCFYFFPIAWFTKQCFDFVLVVTDITLISSAIWLMGQMDSDFYLLYFLVIMMASVSHNIYSILLSALICSIVYLLMNYLGQRGEVFSTEVLIRIPFFFVVAVFYGHLVIYVRNQKKRTEFAVQLREYSSQLASVLDRNSILEILVKSTQKLCGTENVIIFSRKFKKIEEKDYIVLPINGDVESDLVLAVKKNLSQELIEYLHSLLSSASMALNNSGQYQALIQEVEKRKQVALQLTQALEFKSEFLANMSHELRTPLYCMIGFAELLVDGGYGSLNQEQHKVVNRMRENAKDLLGQINNILDFSKHEAGEIKLKLESRVVTSFVKDIVDYCNPLVRDKSLTIEVLDHTNHENIMTDWNILRHVLVNLISNAVKFTEKGSVSVEINIDHVLKQLHLKVSDTGVGIDVKYFEEIFVAFRQVDGVYTKKYAGTGLGLAICKKQIEMLNGSISVSSKLGIGSEFLVKIPISFELNLVT